MPILLYICYDIRRKTYARIHLAAKINRVDRRVETHKGIGDRDTEREDFGRSVKDFFISVKVLVCNLPFLLLLGTAICDGGGIVAFSTFLPKIIQFQYGQTPSMAALIAGDSTVSSRVV